MVIAANHVVNHAANEVAIPPARAWWICASAIAARISTSFAAFMVGRVAIATSTARAAVAVASTAASGTALARATPAAATAAATTIVAVGRQRSCQNCGTANGTAPGAVTTAANLQKYTNERQVKPGRVKLNWRV